MIEPKHTQGPWETDGLTIWGPSKRPEWSRVCIANVNRGIAGELDGEANKRLIEAAPDLLEALQHAVRWFDQLKPEDIARYRIALAKAGVK